MHSMVGAFGTYTVKRRRVELVRGYCYRFIQCSFPCGIVMLTFSILCIIVGAGQLIYILHFNGCNTSTTTTDNEGSIIANSSFKCNRQTMKVLGITFLVIGCVVFFISVIVTKYSRSSEENNVIRTTTTTTSTLLTNNKKPTSNQHHHHPSPVPHHHHLPSAATHDQNNIVVLIR